ncbi:MAG: hypothetical protein B6U94_05540 [Thermofilum sp. ex4484_79]|nr:MAG: hypothetical protein B6U94_05540 [Thermofilum sp. ex4484_79]
MLIRRRARTGVCALSSFERSIPTELVGFYAVPALAFVRLYDEASLTACRWLIEVVHHAA